MGTPPKHTRLQLQGGAANGGKIVVKLYTPIPQLHKITRTKIGTKVEEEIHPGGYDENMMPLPANSWDEFKPTLDDEPGTNYQHRDEQTVFLVVDDGDYYYDIHVTDQVLMSFGFPPVAVEDFYEDQIVTNLANFFGIAPENIRFVDVIREDSRKRRSTDMIYGASVEVNANSTEEATQIKVWEVKAKMFQDSARLNLKFWVCLQNSFSYAPKLLN